MGKARDHLKNVPPPDLQKQMEETGACLVEWAYREGHSQKALEGLGSLVKQSTI